MEVCACSPETDQRGTQPLKLPQRVYSKMLKNHTTPDIQSYSTLGCRADEPGFASLIFNL